MAREQQEYDDIPGTFVFDAERSRQGYGINMFCMSLLQEENRKAFKANEAENYLKKFNLTPAQTDAILKARLQSHARARRQHLLLYGTSSAPPTGTRSSISPRWMTGKYLQSDYAKMMLEGGRSVRRQPLALRRRTSPLSLADCCRCRQEVRERQRREG